MVLDKVSRLVFMGYVIFVYVDCHTEVTPFSNSKAVDKCVFTIIEPITNYRRKRAKTQGLIKYDLIQRLE